MKFQPRAKETLPSFAPFTNRNEKGGNKDSEGGNHWIQPRESTCSLYALGFLLHKIGLGSDFIKTEMETGLPSPKSSIFWRVMGCSSWKENKYALIKLKRNFSTANEEPSPRLFPFASLFSFWHESYFSFWNQPAKGGGGRDTHKLKGNCWYVQFQADSVNPQPFWAGLKKNTRWIF